MKPECSASPESLRRMHCTFHTVAFTHFRDGRCVLSPNAFEADFEWHESLWVGNREPSAFDCDPTVTMTFKQAENGYWRLIINTGPGTCDSRPAREEVLTEGTRIELGEVCKTVEAW
jgi:hypothetical protein